ncbi:MAG: hypothetical protein NTY70_16375, partial [Burkholderiales bacterium]|nr:hypothetical protein [Burkholderiales bacterium]
MLSNRRFRKPPFIVRALRKMRVQVASMRLAPKSSLPPVSKTAGVAPVMPVLGAHKAPHLPPVVAKPEQKPKVKKRRIWPYFFLFFIGLLAAACWWVWQETRSYEKQAEFFAKLAAQLTYKVEPGASPANKIRFPHDSPYDERMGYANMPDFLTKLQAKDFTITAQARISPKMVEMADRGFFATYREKNGVGLSILDCRQQPLFAARYPERFYANFDATPKVLIDSL